MSLSNRFLVFTINNCKAFLRFNAIKSNSCEIPPKARKVNKNCRFSLSPWKTKKLQKMKIRCFFLLEITRKITECRQKWFSVAKVKIYLKNKTTTNWDLTRIKNEKKRIDIFSFFFTKMATEWAANDVIMDGIRFFGETMEFRNVSNNKTIWF